MAQWITNDHFSFLLRNTFSIGDSYYYLFKHIHSSAKNDWQKSITKIGIVSVMSSASIWQLEHFPKLNWKKKRRRKTRYTEILLWRDAVVEESKLSNDSNYFCEFEIRTKAIKIKKSEKKTKRMCEWKTKKKKNNKKSWIYQLCERCRLPLLYGVYRILQYIWVCWHRRQLFILSILIAVSSHRARVQPAVSSPIFSFSFFFHFDSFLHLAVSTFALDKRTRALCFIYP